MSDVISSLLKMLDLTDTGARTNEDIFTAASQRNPLGRIFGGQVLAQALTAAMRTIPDDRVAHSMHGYFLRSGDVALPITFAVDRIHDGRSFSTRRTQAYQLGLPIFSMIASFQSEDTGLDHQADMPADLPDPLSLPTALEGLSGVEHPSVRSWVSECPFDIRHISSPIFLRVEGEHVPHQAVWMRAVGQLPDNLNVHRAALAYASDYTILESIFGAHGVPWGTPGLKAASLDHAMWWHRAGRVDEWMLYAQESPSAVGGRGLALGKFFRRDGILVASVAQEGMVRVPGFSRE
jgi:acyl-CoA thioesterase-2